MRTAKELLEIITAAANELERRSATKAATDTTQCHGMADPFTPTEAEETTPPGIYRTKEGDRIEAWPNETGHDAHPTLRCYSCNGMGSMNIVRYHLAITCPRCKGSGLDPDRTKEEVRRGKWKHKAFANESKSRIDEMIEAYGEGKEIDWTKCPARGGLALHHYNERRHVEGQPPIRRCECGKEQLLISESKGKCGLWSDQSPYTQTK